LAPAIGGIALLLNALWIYLNIRHWKDPDADYMTIAITIIGTGLLWIGLAGAIWWNIKNALETKRFRETHKKQLPTDRVQFYQGRNDPGRPRLHDVINGASLVWIATHTAGNIRNSDLLRHPIERLILLDPNGVALESLSQITLDRTAD